MSVRFSKNLIIETIKCFKEEDGIDITPKQANEYLDSFAGLYLAFSSKRSSQHSLEGGGTLEVDNLSGSSLGSSNT